MRPIKFRAWDKAEKVMIYDANSDIKIYLNGAVSQTGEWVTGYFDLMQFTGLLDKNGKEIYEGDILATYEGEELGWCSAGQVFWWNDEAKFMLADKEGYSTEDENWETPSEWKGYEVIGNIYENSELIGSKANT